MSDEDRAAWWNARYSDGIRPLDDADDWVDPYLADPGTTGRVLELGCGTAVTSRRLLDRGYDVVATDISDVALERARKLAPALATKQIDMTNRLPFAERAFGLVVADLCLHYFGAETTTSILVDIARVLVPGGMLLARVNSDADVNYGAGRGREVEPGFYEVDGHYKRFFSESTVREFLAGWTAVSVLARETGRYGRAKSLLEISARTPEAAGTTTPRLPRT